MTHTFQDTGLSYYQHTLADSFTCIGRGLHTGLRVVMTVLPAETGTGYVFTRRDVPLSKSQVPARWYMVTDTHLSTTVSNNMGVRVSTIEHLLAALHACGVDNATIVLDAPEVPIMDGSAAPFVEIIECIGTVQQSAERRAILVRQPVSVTEGSRSAAFEPSPIPWIDMDIDFQSNVIGKQSISMPFNQKVFQKDIASARTFGFEEQVETLKELGFAQGSSLRNAILVSGGEIENEEGLRFEDEFVRHKYLDVVGDMALVGGYIIGRFKGSRSGHHMNNNLLRELMTTDSVRMPMTLRQADAFWHARFLRRSDQPENQ